jgi:hypothetical protein
MPTFVVRPYLQVTSKVFHICVVLGDMSTSATCS